jgi:adenine deaminase
VKKGHLDELARSAMTHGIDFMTAIQMVTLNPATSYHLERQIGCLAPGNFADLVILSDTTQNFQVEWTIASGAVAMEDRRVLADRTPFVHDPVMADTFHLAPLTVASFLRVANAGATSARVHVMTTDPADPYTGGMEAMVPVVGGWLGCVVAADILHIAVVERHHATGRIGRGWIHGFGLKQGALAISMAHDSHNIIVLGAEPKDMLVAVERLSAIQGGLVFVENGAVIQEIATPLFGLLTDLDAWTLCDELSRLMSLLQAKGCPLAEPHMRMMFFTIACGPYYRLTDRGYVKAKPDHFELMENVLEWLA